MTIEPTNAACKEFRRVYNKTHISPEAQIRASLTAALAVQFPQVEKHAELVNQLRSINEERLSIQPYFCEQLCKKAADALESVLAERDALRKWKEDDSDAMRIFARYRELEAERDAPLARLAPVDDEALVDIAVETWVELTTGMARRPSAYTISERAGARAAIAAIRPHIEATERERLNGVIQSYQILLETQQRMFVDVQAERDGLAARLDFWISRR